MKIDLGGGAYLEPDEGPRDSPYHKRVMMIRDIPNTLVGHYLRLECGHEVQVFGDLAHCGGVILCATCRDQEKPSKMTIGEAFQAVTEEFNEEALRCRTDKAYNSLLEACVH